MRGPNLWHASLETAGLAAIGAAICFLLRSADPLLLSRGLAWLALAPLLAGLRYGSSFGVGCACAQFGALALVANPNAEIALGWLLSGLLSGVFRDRWGRQLQRSSERANQSQHRLEVLARSFHVLRASHDRLQREIPSTISLRDALEALSRELIDSPRPQSIEALGGRVLEVFREHAFVHAATLHALDDQGRPGQALAALGTTRVSGDDPLLRHAARLGELVSVRDASLAAGVLVAVPLVDVAGKVHGVVAVREMPFLALHDDTLSLLSILGAQAGDVLSHALAGERHTPERVAAAAREPSGIRGEDHEAVA